MELMDLFMKHGILPQNDVLRYLEKKPLSYVEEIIDNTNLLFLTKNDLRLVEAKLNEKRRKNWGDRIEVIKDITGKSTSKGELVDFVKYFNSRLKILRKLLRKRGELMGSVTIDGALRGDDNEVRIIGIVKSLRETSGGSRIFELEDEGGSISVLCSDRKQMSRIALDSVLGVIASKGRDILYAKDIIFPDVILERNLQRADEDVSVVFTSDVHLGSKTFMKEKWRDFIDWLKNDSGNVRYVLFCGDNVDGVGIYPKQDRDLEVTDVYKQYELFASEIDGIPKNMEVIVIPGNHDTVRPAEPQPTLPSEITKILPRNVHALGNPCTIKICGVPILAYHGRSMDDLIYSNPDFTHNKPIDMMVEMLKLRHLVPIYGGRTPIAPETTDYLVIDEIPDIFITGHVHSFGIGRYRNVSLINGSTWQSQTSYQKMMGFEPNPGNIAIVNLMNGGLASKSF